MLQPLVIVCGAATAIMLASGLAPGIATRAEAVPPIKVAFTKIGIYPRVAPSMEAARTGQALADGTVISVACEQEGQSATSSAGTSRIWEKLTNGSWLPNVFVETGVNGWTPNVPRCAVPVTAPPPAQPPTGALNRSAAVAYAKANWNGPTKYGNDCTWFVSQALWAGGMAQDGDWTAYTTDFFKMADKPHAGPSVTAVNANQFVKYLVATGKATKKTLAWSDYSSAGAQLGDVIAYDWDNGADGTIDHVAIVVGFAAGGGPIVAQHSSARVDRYWSWDPGAANWVQNSHPGALAYLIKITP